MSKPWQYQIRLYLTELAAKTARNDAGNSLLASLTKILRVHDATLVNQLTAFESYVAHAEKDGVENFPLHKWTKAVIDDPVKREKYAQTFTVHVSGHEVYGQEAADALEADLQPLVGGELIVRISKHDTNPENNPQIPPQYRS